MSILLIKYAMNFCSEEQVKDVFNTIFDEAIVEKVVTVEKTDTFTHKKSYKMFFIHFDKTNRRLEHFIDQIKTTGFQQVIYDKKGYYWKVIIAETKISTSTAIAPVFLPARIEETTSTVSDTNILFIKYAKNDCTEEQVKLYLDTSFGEELVEKVVTVEKKDFKTGDPFKMFFIHFNKTNGHLEYVIEVIKSYMYYKIFLEADKKFYWKLQIPIKKEEPFVPAIVEVPDELKTPVKEVEVKDKECPQNKARGWAPELDLTTDWAGEPFPLVRTDSIDLYPEAKRLFAEIDREEGEINFESDSSEEKELSVEDIDRMIHTVTIPIKEDLKAPFVSDKELDKKDVALKHTVCDVILEDTVLTDIMSKVSLEPRLEDIFEPRPVKLQRKASASPAKKQKVSKVV